MDMYALLNHVHSKETFQQFLLALVEDWDNSRRQEEQALSSHYGPAANGWENTDIGQFLERMLAWSYTTNFLTNKLSVPEEPSWRTFAQMLYAAKGYE